MEVETVVRRGYVVVVFRYEGRVLVVRVGDLRRYLGGGRAAAAAVLTVVEGVHASFVVLLVMVMVVELAVIGHMRRVRAVLGMMVLGRRRRLLLRRTDVPSKWWWRERRGVDGNWLTRLQRWQNGGLAMCDGNKNLFVFSLAMDEGGREKSCHLVRWRSNGGMQKSMWKWAILSMRSGLVFRRDSLRDFGDNLRHLP